MMQTNWILIPLNKEYSALARTLNKLEAQKYGFSLYSFSHHTTTNVDIWPLTILEVTKKQVEIRILICLFYQYFNWVIVLGNNNNNNNNIAFQSQAFQFWARILIIYVHHLPSDITYLLLLFCTINMWSLRWLSISYTTVGK